MATFRRGRPRADVRRAGLAARRRDAPSRRAREIVSRGAFLGAGPRIRLGAVGAQFGSTMAAILRSSAGSRPKRQPAAFRPNEPCCSAVRLSRRNDGGLCERAAARMQRSIYATWCGGLFLRLAYPDTRIGGFTLSPCMRPSMSMR